MARYRKIDVRMWNDRKFRELSDNAKLAFILLLTHPDTTQIGTIRTRVSNLADELGWQRDAMSHAIQEVTLNGMIDADEKAGLMVINNFLKYNAPSSPNAFKSWRELIDLMPECDLLDRHVASLKAFVDSLSAGMRNAIPNDLMDAIKDAILRVNEQPSRIQEQEQEQEKNKKENIKEKNPPTTSGLENQSEEELPFSEPETPTISKTETVEKKAKRKSKAKQPCPFNDGDAIPEDFVKVAEQYHIANPQLLFQKMISYCKSNGKEYVDYKAAFRTFCIQDQERSRGKQSPGANGNNSAPMPYEPPGGFTEDYYRKGCKFDDKGNILL